MSVDAKAPIESPEVKEILARYRDVWAVYYGDLHAGWSFCGERRSQSDAQEARAEAIDAP